jgi:predicted transcriptional regulator
MTKELIAQIAAAYFAANPTKTSEIPNVIETIRRALEPDPATPGRPIQNPAVDPKQSVHPDYIVCLEDGKKLKMLRRHLRTHYRLSPEEYRAKWGLPANYPMTAPNYSKTRTKLAKKQQLGVRTGQNPAKHK